MAARTGRKGTMRVIVTFPMGVPAGDNARKVEAVRELIAGVVVAGSGALNGCSLKAVAGNSRHAT